MLTKTAFFSILNDANNRIGDTAHIAYFAEGDLIIRQYGAPNCALSMHRYPSTTEAAFAKYDAWLNEWFTARAAAKAVEAEQAEVLTLDQQAVYMVEPAAPSAAVRLAKTVARCFAPVIAVMAVAVAVAAPKPVSAAYTQEQMVQITKAINKNFYDADLYRGKHCRIMFKIDPYGTPLEAIANYATGNPNLCTALLDVIGKTNMPPTGGHEYLDMDYSPR